MLTKVLGIGSPFGDDQLGWIVADALKQELLMRDHNIPSLIIESHDRPGMRLIELMSGASTVFLIDAVQSGREIGTIHHFSNKDISQLENSLSTHGIGVIQALQVGSALNDLPDNIIFYGIEIDKIVLDSTLSHSVDRSVKKVVIQLINELISA